MNPIQKPCKALLGPELAPRQFLCKQVPECSSHSMLLAAWTWKFKMVWLHFIKWSCTKQNNQILYQRNPKIKKKISSNLKISNCLITFYCSILKQIRQSDFISKEIKQFTEGDKIHLKGNKILGLVIFLWILVAPKHMGPCCEIKLLADQDISWAGLWAGMELGKWPWPCWSLQVTVPAHCSAINNKLLSR